MAYFRWFLLVLIDLIMLLLVFPLTPVLCLFTAKGWPSLGSWFWTYDNPPQGDEGFQRERAPYCPASNSWELYVNRVFWLWRNPSYGYAKYAGIYYGSGLKVKIISQAGAGVNTSDKYRNAGHYFVKCFNAFDEVIGFEFYAVIPYSKNHCLRCRIGWKMQTDKFKTLGFAPLVHMVNPFKQYGED